MPLLLLPLLLLLLLLLSNYHTTMLPITLLQIFSSPGVVELTTQLLILVNILWLPLCRINKFGLYFTLESCCDPLHLWVIKTSKHTYTSTTHFLRENHLLMCWYQDIPIQSYESWSLAFPKLLSTQIFFPPNPILWERECVECWGDYHLNHKSKEFIINTPFVTSWGVVSPRLARCHLGASNKIVELN